MRIRVVGKRWSFEGGVRGKGSFEGGVRGKGSFEGRDERGWWRG